MTLTVTDVNGNSSTCTSTITVVDAVNPIAVCQPVTVQLDNAGAGSITTAQVNNGSSDACGIASYSLSNSSFTCANVGSNNTVTLTVTDNNGNSSTCTSTITVVDAVNPVAVCQPVTVQLNASGAGSITTAQVNNGSSDACGIASYSLSNSSFNCANVGSNNTVTLTVTDNNGNSSTCTSTITVVDAVAPVALCQNTTIQLNAAGTATLSAAAVNNSSTDACGIATLSVSPNTFNCTNITGAAPTELLISEYVEGSSNNKYIEIYNPTATSKSLSNYQLRVYTNGSSSPTSVTLPSGTLAPGATVVYKNSSATVYSGAATTLTNVVWNGNDAIALFNTVSGQNVDIFGRIGNDPGTAWTLNGNTTIDKTLRRNPSVLSGVTVNPTGTGAGAFLTLGTEWTQFNIDVVSGLGSHSVNAQGNAVTLTVTDVNGNSSTCSAIVTVQDNVAPVAQCHNLTVQLNASGSASITAAQVNNNSSDACGIASYSLSNSTFTCANVGSNNTVTLTVTDVNGNSSTCTSTITVQDNIAPNAICRPVTVQLNASGIGSITTTQVNNGSTDNCAIATYALSNSSFTCANVGTNNSVTLTVTDVNGNASTCTSVITVQDNVAPNAICQNITLQLDSAGNGSITAAQVNNTSTDACGIASLSVTPNAFNCSNVDGDQPTDLFISEYIEGSGNNKCIEIYNGTGASVNLASYSLFVSFNGGTSTQVFNLSGTLANGGTHVVCNPSASPSFTNVANQTSTVISFNGNDAVVLRKNGVDIDIIGSVGQNPGNEWTGGGNSTLDRTLVRNATVAAGNTSNALNFPTLASQWTSFPIDNSSNLASHNFTGTGVNAVVLTVTDVNGNSSTCNANVTVEDNVAPVALCQNLTINLASSGNQTVAATSIDAGSTDACGIATRTLSPNTFDCNDLGANSVTLTIVDNNGNVSACNATVTVTNDPLVATVSSPVFACGYNVSCNGNNDGTATVATTGGCLAYSYAWSNGQTTATASGLVAGNYSVTVTDANGTTTTASITLTQPAPLAITSLTSPVFNGGWNVSCNGFNDGAIDLTVAGGATCQAYSYAWSNGATTEDLTGLTAGTYSVTITDANGCSTSSSITLTQPDPVTIALIPQVYQGGWNITCNGANDGMIFSNNTGGTAPYTYLWSNGATTQLVNGLTAGTYSVTVTDQNGCFVVDQITLTEPPLMTDAISSPVFSCGYNVTCNGAIDGSIDYTVNGGTAPYSYIWSNGATTQDLNGLGAGTYSVTATDRNGCTTSSTITLTEPALLTANITLGSYACGYNVSCNGASDGSAVVNVTGGCAPYTYTWSTPGTAAIVNGLPAITVFVTVTDANGCQAFASEELTEPDPLSSTGVAATYACGTNVSCNGASDGSIDLSVTGGASCQAYSYLWSNGATTEDISGLSAGTYSVTITDVNGCSTTNSFTITEPAILASTGVAATYLCGTNISCKGAADGSIDLTVTGGANCQAYTFNWSNGATTEDVNGLTAGTYSVTVTDANGCSTTSSFTLTQPAILTGAGVVSSYACGTGVSCNGATDGSIDMTVNGGASCLAYSFAWSNGATSEDLSNLGAGTYSVTVTDANGCNFSRTFTITEPDQLRINSMTPATYACGFNISCNGASDGAIDLNVDGGANCQAYSFAWSNGATTEDISGLTAGTYSVTVTDANGCSTTSSVTLTQPAPLQSTGVAATYACGTNISCHGANDGAINLSVTGGAVCQAYSYIWSNGATTEDLNGLTAGSYSVTITDANGCSTTNSFTLIEPAVLASSGTVLSFNCGYNVSCNGANDGSIDLTVVGGASCTAYTYNWSNGATTEDISGLVAGTYTVTVHDANGCSTVSTFTLTQPSLFEKTNFSSPTFACGYNVSCNGSTDGSINLDATGGCAPYTYLWSDGATTEDRTGLAAGFYSVTATDANGCSFTDGITLTEPAALSLNLVPFTYACGTNISCNGAHDGSIGLTVSGGASCLAYTYSWSNGATTEDLTGLAAGTYTVTVTDANGCSTTGTVTLTQPAPIAVTSVTSPTYVGGYNIRCFGENNGAMTVNFGGGANCLNSTVTISGPQTISLTGIGSVTFTGLTAGSYSVLVTDANGCTATSSKTLTQPAALVSNAGPDVCVQYGYQTVNCTTLVGSQTGGVAPYTVRWNLGSSTGTLLASTSSVQVCPTVTTTYCYTVTDANGCTYTDCVVVNVTDIRCGNNLQKVTICHIPPGSPGNPQTLCVAANAVGQHVGSHGGDYLGACGATNPCGVVPAKTTEETEASSAAAAHDLGLAELIAFPNPFNHATTLKFSLPNDGSAVLKVYSMTGEEVAVLFDGMAEAGIDYEIEWKPENVSSGIYFAKLVTNDGKVLNHKLILTK